MENAELLKRQRNEQNYDKPPVMSYKENSKAFRILCGVENILQPPIVRRGREGGEGGREAREGERRGREGGEGGREAREGGSRGREGGRRRREGGWEAKDGGREGGIGECTNV